MIAVNIADTIEVFFISNNIELITAEFIGTDITEC